MKKWKPPRGCIPVDFNKEVHPEPGVYDFTKLKPNKSAINSEMKDAARKARIMQGLYQVFFSSEYQMQEKEEMILSKNQLIIPNLDRESLRHNDIETILKNVETERVNESNFKLIAGQIYDALGPVNSPIIEYNKFNANSWSLGLEFRFMGVIYNIVNLWFQIKTSDYGINIFKFWQVDFVNERDSAVYFKETSILGTPEDPFELLYLKLK